MGNFFSPNIGRRGRIARGVWGAALVAVALLVSGTHPWMGFWLLAFGVFAFYEALRGWCVMRACGIKTKL
jgi:hypothetical protein